MRDCYTTLGADDKHNKKNTENLVKSKQFANYLPNKMEKIEFVEIQSRRMIPYIKIAILTCGCYVITNDKNTFQFIAFR